MLWLNKLALRIDGSINLLLAKIVNVDETFVSDLWYILTFHLTESMGFELLKICFFF